MKENKNHVWFSFCSSCDLYRKITHYKDNPEYFYGTAILPFCANCAEKEKEKEKEKTK